MSGEGPQPIIELLSSDDEVEEQSKRPPIPVAKRRRRSSTPSPTSTAAATTPSSSAFFVLEEDLDHNPEKNGADNEALAAFRQQQQHNDGVSTSLLFTDEAFPCHPASIRGAKKDKGLTNLETPTCRKCRKAMPLTFTTSTTTQQKSPVFQCPTCKFCLPALKAERMHWYRLGLHTGHVLVDSKVGFRAQDLQQGKVGDCWFLSALAVVAERPDLIQRLFPQTDLSEDGVVQVRLFVDGWWKVVTIDNALPCLIDGSQEQALETAMRASLNESSSGGIPFSSFIGRGRSSSSSSVGPQDPHALIDATRSVLFETQEYLERQCLRLTGRPFGFKIDKPLMRPVTSQDLAYSKAALQQLWVPFIEKAYAKSHGSYQSISGGHIAEAFLDLTGAPTAVHILHGPGFQPRSFWQKLMRYRRQGLPMGCGTQSSAVGIIGMHAYSILDVREIKNVDFKFFQQTGAAHGNVSGFTEYDGTVRLLRIRNPHGKGEWKGDFSDRSATWEKLLEHGGASLTRTLRNDGTFWIDYDNFLMAFYNVDVVLAFKGNHAKSFQSNFPSKMSNHRCTRAFEVTLVPDATMNENVEIYCMGIQKTKRGAKHGRMDRKVSYKVSDLGMIVGEVLEGSEQLTSVRGSMFGFNRNGHQRLTFDPKTTSRLVVCPISFGHPAATDKELPFVVRFVSDAPLMIRELENVPRMDSAMEQYCLSSTPCLAGQGVRKVLLEVKNSFRVVQVDCRADRGGTVFLYLCVNESTLPQNGVSLSIEATCRGMSCRTVKGLIAHETIAKGKKFEAAWRKFSVDCMNEAKSRLLLVLYQSGQDTEFGAISCVQNHSRSLFAKKAASTLDHFVGLSRTDGYNKNGIFNAPPNSQAFSRSMAMPAALASSFHDSLVDSRENGDAALQEALQKSLLESGSTEEELLERALAESRGSVSAKPDFDSELQRVLELSRKDVEVPADNSFANVEASYQRRASTGSTVDDSLLVDLTNDDPIDEDNKKPRSLEEKRRLAAQAALKRQTRRPLSPSLYLTIVLKLFAAIALVGFVHGIRPVSYELHKAVDMHGYHRHLLRTNANATAQLHWRNFQHAQATRHLSRYEYAFRKSNELDIMMNWDGSYLEDADPVTEELFQSLSQRIDASSQHHRRLSANTSHLVSSSKGRNMDAYQAVPLSQGYGTHLANIWVGSPHPQRKTVIVDTGSHFTAFPCTGCHNCGGSYHTDPYFDPSKSNTFHRLRCEECIGVTCQQNECLFSQSYTEGSSWDAVQVRDRLYAGGKDVLDAVEPKDQKYAIPFMFGCMTTVNGLFLTQLADGIMGMSAHEATLTKQLWNKGILEHNMFALCFRRELGTSKRGVAAGSMTLGGVSTNLDSSPVVYAKNMAKSGWFTVYVKNIYVRAGGGQSAAPTPHTRTVRVNVDLTALNSGKGVIVDSGTTDTYLNKAVAPAFRRAWKSATGGKPYSHFPMRLSDEELARLPTILVQCHAYSAMDPSVDDYNDIPGYAGALDDSSPNDLLIAIPATSYMDYSPITKMYTSRLYLTETNGGVLGSNTMQGHNVIFDWRLGRIGFAESSCTYDKRDLPPEQADEDSYPADCVVNQPILTTACVDTVDKSLCGYLSNNSILLGQQKWTALVESPGASNGLTCQETAGGSKERKTDDDVGVPDEDFVQCRGDGVCEEGHSCQLTCNEVKREASVKTKPQDNERLGCGDSYWSACDRGCRQTRLHSMAFSDGLCHEVSREIRPCHTDACLRESPCLVPFLVHLVIGFHGLSIREWTFAADDLISRALVETTSQYLGQSPFADGDINVVFSLPWYLDEDSPEAALRHKSDKDIASVGVKAIIDISIVNHGNIQKSPVNDSRTDLNTLGSVLDGWAPFLESAVRCQEKDMHRLAKVALSVKKEVFGDPSFMQALVDKIILIESQTRSPNKKGSALYFSPVFSQQSHVRSSRLLSTWSIPTGLKESINYYGPHRPIWYMFLRFLHVATIVLMTVVLLWSLLGASSSIRDVCLRLGLRWRLPQRPLWPYSPLIRRANATALDVSIAEEGITLELAAHQPRSRNSTTVLKRKGSLHDGSSGEKNSTSHIDKPRLAPEASVKRKPRRRPSPAVQGLTVLTTIFLSGGFSFAQGVPPLWPLPRNCSFNDDSDSRVLRTVSLAQGFEFDLTGKHNDQVVEVVRQAQSRFLTVLLADIPRNAKQYPVNPGHKSIWNVLGIHIRITTNDFILRHAVNESYRLELRPPIDNDAYMVLTAPTVYGVLHGLSTLVQLLSFGWIDESGAPVYRVLGSPFDISDTPFYPYRGMLIDTSRHYLPTTLIIQNLDAMAWNKMNVLHWHIVDSQSWPYQSKAFPELTKGAYCTYCVYTPDDVKLIIREAALRGIRVVPEFDLPGHSQAIAASHPELMTFCDGKRAEPLDATKQEVYSFIYKLYDEINATFTSDFVHIGGDEVNLDCWHHSPEVQDWMQDHNMTKEEDLLQYFETKLLECLHKQMPKKRLIVWQELFDSGLKLPNESVVVDVWKEWVRQETISNATQQGFTVVVSSCWYLDYLNEDVEQFYNCSPAQFLETSKQKDLVAGGHVSMWGERVDESNFFGRVYPRASAAAEKLWTGENYLAKATYPWRLERFRCLLVRLGIPSEPLGPGSCTGKSSTREGTKEQNKKGSGLGLALKRDNWSSPVANMHQQEFTRLKSHRKRGSDTVQGKYRTKKQNLRTRIGNTSSLTADRRGTVVIIVCSMMILCFKVSRNIYNGWLFSASFALLLYFLCTFYYAAAWRQVLPLFPQTRQHSFPQDTPTAVIHQHFMGLAMDQARQAAQQNEVPIGAIVVHNMTALETEQATQHTFRVLSTGRNAIEGKHDASAHAELLALRRAGRRLKNWRLGPQCTLFSTLEPCAMCVSACQAFRIGEIVYGAPDLRLGAIETHLQLLNIVQHPFHNVSVTARGVLEDDSAELLRSFFRARRQPKTRAGDSKAARSTDFFQHCWNRLRRQ